MKVYYNHPNGSCGYGGILIASNSLQEAIETWHNDSSFNSMIGDDFEEIKGLNFDGDKPQIVLDDWGYC